MVCTLGPLASPGTATVTIGVTPTAAGPLSNTATVASPTPDPNPTNSPTTPPVLTTVEPSADLAITKEGLDTATVGTPCTYTITVTNLGPSSASDVTVTDLLPPTGVTVGLVTPSQGTCSGTSPMVCTLGPLASPGTATVTIVVTPTAAGPLSNTATVASPTPDPNTTNSPTTPPVLTTVTSAPSAGPLGGSAFSNAGGSMSSATYPLMIGVA